MHPAVALGQEPEVFSIRQKSERGFRTATAYLSHPRVVVKRVAAAGLAAVGVDGNEPAILVVVRAGGGDRERTVLRQERHGPTDVAAGKQGIRGLRFARLEIHDDEYALVLRIADERARW